MKSVYKCTTGNKVCKGSSGLIGAFEYTENYFDKVAVFTFFSYAYLSVNFAAFAGFFNFIFINII